MDTYAVTKNGVYVIGKSLWIETHLSNLYLITYLIKAFCTTTCQPRDRNEIGAFRSRYLTVLVVEKKLVGTF